MAVPILTVSDIQEIERKLQAKKKPPPLPPRQRALSNLRRSDPVELMVHRNTVAEEGYRSSPETPDPGMRASANTPLIETEYPPIPQSEEEKRAARRIQVAKELVSTEKTYCKSLQQIVSDYLHPLKLDPSLQKKKKLDIIFMNTEEIMLLHLPMLHDLEQCVTNNNSNNIGEIFLKTASYNFSLYKTFCAQYAEALSCLAECIQNSSKFAAFIQAQDGQLESLLIQPVQRIPRYRLLFGELLKYTPEDHPDYQPTVKALKCIEEIAIHVNESVREKENQDKLLQIQQSFTNKAPTIVNPHRKFIREGILVKMCRRTPKRRYFFLFSDLLIYGSTNELAANMNRVTYTFHRSSDLSQVIVEDIPVEDGGTDNAFHIRSNQKSFVVFAEDYEAKKAWMNDFNVAKNYGKTGTNDGDAEIAPIWVPDKLVKNCMQCNVKFTTINRRHHCRKCGDLVCSACSSKKFTLPNIGKLCRVCEICFRVLNDGTVDPRSVEKKPLASKEKFNLAQTATKKFAGIEGRGTAVNINVAYSSLLDKDEPTNTVPSDTVSSAPTTPAPTPPLSPSLQTKKPMSDSVAYLATLKTNSNRRARNISPRGGSPLAGDSDYPKECPITVPPPPPPRKNSI